MWEKSSGTNLKDKNTEKLNRKYIKAKNHIYDDQLPFSSVKSSVVISSVTDSKQRKKKSFECLLELKLEAVSGVTAGKQYALVLQL